MSASHIAPPALVEAGHGRSLFTFLAEATGNVVAVFREARALQTEVAKRYPFFME